MKTKKITETTELEKNLYKITKEMLIAQHDELYTKLYVNKSTGECWTITEADYHTYQEYNDDNIVIADSVGGVYCDCDICQDIKDDKIKDITECDDYGTWEQEYADKIIAVL